MAEIATAGLTAAANRLSCTSMRLWLRLFFMFAVLSGAALLAFAVWQQHSFRDSFLGYLDAQTLQRLQPAAARLVSAYAKHGDWDFLRAHPERLGELIEPMPVHPPGGGVSGGPAEHAAGHPEHMRAPAAAAEFGMPPDMRHHPHGPPPGPPHLMSRLLLVDAAGRPVAGDPHVSGKAAVIPLLLASRQIGELRLAPLPQISGASDVAFARTQMRSALLAGVIILVGALLLALALARWLLGPVRVLADATQALAGGDYSTRTHSRRSDELGALSRDFDRLARTLEQHQQARRQWGADIAHELRTPLSILRGEVQALQDGVRPFSRAAVDSLAAECERLGHLIEDLYQLSLADAGALEYRFAMLDFAQIVNESMELSRSACRDAGLALEGNIAAVPPLRGDARRLAQLVDNLLANARRYTHASGRIRITLDECAHAIRLVIDDTPPGVAADALPRLFDRLYRVDSARTSTHGGAGLGLAICQAIVQAHGGSIRAEASPLGGLRVCVEFPVHAT